MPSKFLDHAGLRKNYFTESKLQQVSFWTRIEKRTWVFVARRICRIQGLVLCQVWAPPSSYLASACRSTGPTPECIKANPLRSQSQGIFCCLVFNLSLQNLDMPAFGARWCLGLRFLPFHQREYQLFAWGWRKSARSFQSKRHLQQRFLWVVN